MDDINSALEKIVVLDKAATRLDLEMSRHLSRFRQFFDEIDSHRSNELAAKRFTSDIKKISTRVKAIQDKMSKMPEVKNKTYQTLFLNHTDKVLIAQNSLIDFIFNPKSKIKVYDLLRDIFEQPYEVVLDTQKNRNKKEKLDIRRQSLSRHFNERLLESTDRNQRKISEVLLPGIKKLLIDFASENDMLVRPFDFDIYLTEGNSYWHVDDVYLDMKIFRYTKENGCVNVHLANALREASHEFLGHGVHQINSERLSSSLVANDNNEFGLVQRASTEGFADYMEKKFLSYLRRNYWKVKIKVPDGFSERFNKVKIQENKANGHRFITISPNDIEEMALDFELDYFWYAQRFIAHTNQIQDPLSEPEKKTLRQTRNYSLVKNSEYKDETYSQRILGIAAVYGGPYFRKTISRVRSEYGIPLRLAEKVTSVGSWSIRPHYPFVELLLETMGCQKRPKKQTEIQQTI